ncbi:MAG: acetolactate synthase large subunit [Magnetococcales bacterium]|nr:acetolactate synthase large subunit [Magnetococcales bacterium]
MTDAAPNRKASDLFVSCLEAEGVKRIYAVPGEENLDLLESLRGSSIDLVLTRHEQAAAFMAATQGRLTGEAGVVMTTLGPGATNLLTGIAFAQLGGMPLVAITGQKPVKRSKQGQFQILDVVSALKPVTKMAESIPSGDRIPSMVRQAFKCAEEERPGAVHLELPEDIARESTSATVIPEGNVRRPAPDSSTINGAVRMLTEAKRPLLMIASGANRKRISDSLQAFVQHTGIPFFTTQMGKGVLDERDERFLGTAALTANDYVHCAIDRADLIITIGHDVTEKPPAILGHHGTARVIHVNFYSAVIDDVYAPSLEVVGDISASLEALTQRITPSPAWDFSYYHRSRSDTLAQITAKSDSAGFPITPQRFVHDLRTAIPDDGVLTLDNGMYKIWVARNYPAYRRNTVLLDNALATMGAGLPQAIGAKLTAPERTVVAVCGDGGFMMNSQELETAVRLKLDLVVIVLNDSAYGMIKWKQADMGFQNFGLDYDNPDFVRYAESYGASGHRVTSAEGFKPLLAQCINAPGVHLIDMPIDYSENSRVLSRELREKVCLI